MDNLLVTKLNVYCPKSVLSRHEELQRVFESAEYCVKVFPVRQSSACNKSYVLRFELEKHRHTHPIQETEELKNNNEIVRQTDTCTSTTAIFK